MYITTAGIGRVIPGVAISPANGSPRRQDSAFRTHWRPRNHDPAGARRAGSGSRSALRYAFRSAAGGSAGRSGGRRDSLDARSDRGGVATSLNELARDCGLGMLLSEDRIPVRDAVRGACELLGLDPLHIANEGQFLAVVDAEYAEAALGALRKTPGGEDAVLIGEVDRSACRIGPGDDAVRRQPHRRHAGGRSLAEDLLDG